LICNLGGAHYGEPPISAGRTASARCYESPDSCRGNNFTKWKVLEL